MTFSTGKAAATLRTDPRLPGSRILSQINVIGRGSTTRVFFSKFGIRNKPVACRHVLQNVLRQFEEFMERAIFKSLPIMPGDVVTEDQVFICL